MTSEKIEGKGRFVPAGYKHCPICDVVVHPDGFLNHVRHSRCRLYKAREKELIRQGQLNCSCPICKESVSRKEIRSHLTKQHSEG